MCNVAQTKTPIKMNFEKTEKIIDKCIAVTLYTLAVSFVLLMICELF